MSARNGIERGCAHIDVRAREPTTAEPAKSGQLKLLDVYSGDGPGDDEALDFGGPFEDRVVQAGGVGGVASIGLSCLFVGRRRSVRPSSDRVVGMSKDGNSPR